MVETKQAIQRMLELARASKKERSQRKGPLVTQEILEEILGDEQGTSDQIRDFLDSLPEWQLRAIASLVYWGRDKGQEDICYVHERLSHQPREYIAQMVAWKDLLLAEYLDTALRLAEEAGLDFEATLCPESVER